jgi:hypothetical protein
MKIVRFFIIFLAFLTFNSGEVLGEPTKTQASAFIVRTNKFLVSAQDALKKSKVYRGDFTLALRHQEWARKMCARNQFAKALYHSRRARLLAIKAIKDNKGKLPSNEAFTKAEYVQLGSRYPTDRELDDVIAMDGMHKLKDEEAVSKPLGTTK